MRSLGRCGRCGRCLLGVRCLRGLWCLWCLGAARVRVLPGRRRGVPALLRDLRDHRRRVPAARHVLRRQLHEPGPLVRGGPVVDGPLREPHVRLLQRRLVRRQLPEPYARVVREVADARQRQPGHAQRAVRLRHDLTAGLGEDAHQLLAQRGLGLRRAHPCEVRGVGRNEVLHAHVGEELSAPDHDQVLGGQRHLAHQVRRDEDGPPLGGQRLHQVAHPQDALGVQTVDGLVEQQHLRVTEERGRDPEPLAHTEREPLGAPLGDVLEPDDPQHLVDPPRRDPGELGQREQVVAGAAPAVHGLGVEQRADLPRRVGQAAEGVSPDRDVPGRGPVQPEDHAHGRRLPGAVGPQEAGDGPRPHLEGKVVHGRLGAVALRQADCLDHSPAPSTGQVMQGTGAPVGGKSVSSA